MSTFEVKRKTEMTDGVVVSDRVLIKKDSYPYCSQYVYVEIKDLPELIKTLQNVKLD